MESLEIRCNPSSIDPLAGSLVEPAPCAAEVTCELAPTDQRAGDPLTYSWTVTRPPIAPDNPVDLQLGTTQESGTDFNLNAFAGQTVRIAIEAADASNDLISVPAPIDPVPIVIDQGTQIGTSLVPIPPPPPPPPPISDGSGRDVLLGGDGRDTLDQAGVLRHELGHALGFQHEHTRPASDASAAAGNLNNDRFAEIITGAAANGHVKVFDGTSGAEIRSFLAFEGFTGGMTVAAGDVDGDGRSGQERPITISGGTGSFVLSFNGDSSTVTGKVTAIDADTSDAGGRQEAPAGYQSGSAGWVKISPDA